MRTLFLALILVFTVAGSLPNHIKRRYFVDNRGSFSAPPPPDILHWGLNQSSSSTITATVGPNGTTDGTWVAVNDGFALDFNGSSQEATSNSNITYGTNIITIAFWAQDINLGDIMGVSGFPDNAFYIGFQDGIIFNINLSMFGNAGTTTSWDAAYPLSAGWHHYLIVLNKSVDNSFTAASWIDGVSNTTELVSGDGSGTASYAATTLTVASRGGASEFWNGAMTDLRIYTGDRSASVALIKAARNP